MSLTDIDINSKEVERHLVELSMDYLQTIIEEVAPIFWNTALEQAAILVESHVVDSSRRVMLPISSPMKPRDDIQGLVKADEIRKLKKGYPDA